MTTMSANRPPRGLREPGRRFWAAVLADYDVNGAELELLRLACESLDIAEDARETLEREGILVEGRFGRRMNPAASVLNLAVLRFARLTRQLHLPPEAAAVAGAPLRRVV
jgi:phage terminase small subunit